MDTVNLNAREKDLPFNLFQIAVLEPAARVIAFNKETLNVNLKGHDEEYLRKLEFFVDTAFPTPQDWWASRQQYLISNVTNDDSERVDYTPDLSDQKIPASDRFVVATDNQEALDEAQQALSVLKEAIEDNRDNDFDDKEEILCDLAVLEATFNQPLINTTLVESIFSTTIRYLTIKFADNAIGIASNALILATAKFIGLV